MDTSIHMIWAGATAGGLPRRPSRSRVTRPGQLAAADSASARRSGRGHGLPLPHTAAADCHRTLVVMATGDADRTAGCEASIGFDPTDLKGDVAGAAWPARLL